MIFNHNIVQRSKRLLFDNGYQTPEVTGGWNVTVNSHHIGDDETRIGETLHLYAHGQIVTGQPTVGRIDTVEKIDLTNKNMLHFKVNISGVRTTKDCCDFVYAVTSVSEDDAWIPSYIRVGSFSGPTDFEAIRSFSHEGVLTLDVSTLSEEYYIALVTRFRSGQADAGTYAYMTVDVERIWWS